MLLIYAGSIICSLLSVNLYSFITSLYVAIPDILCLQSTGLFYPSVNVILWYISAMQIASYLILSLLELNERLYIKIIAPLFIIGGYSILYYYISCLDGTSNIRGYVIPLGLVRAMAGLSIGIMLNIITKSLLRQLKSFSQKDVIIYFSLFLLSQLFTAIGIFIKPHSTNDFICLIAFSVLIVSTQILCVISPTGIINRLGRFLCSLFGKQMTLAMYCFSIIIFRLWDALLGLSDANMYESTLIYLILLFLFSGIISRMNDSAISILRIKKMMCLIKK